MAKDVTPPDKDDDCEVVSSPKQMIRTRKPRRKLTKVPAWLNADGTKCLAYWVHGLSAGDRNRYIDERFVKDEQGRRTGEVDAVHDDFRYLGWVLRDMHGNRIFKDTETAIEWLEDKDPESIQMLVDVANRLTYGPGGEDDASAEGNSETTPTAS